MSGRGVRMHDDPALLALLHLARRSEWLEEVQGVDWAERVDSFALNGDVCPLV